MNSRSLKRTHAQKPIPHRPHPTLSRGCSPGKQTAATAPRPGSNPTTLLQSMADELGWVEPARAGVALQVVLQALREHLAHRTARLTQDLVGLIAGTQTRPRNDSAEIEAEDRAQFLARVGAALPGPATAADTRRVVAAAMDVLDRQCPNCRCADFGLGQSCRCGTPTAEP